ncbi:MAG: hypothetical protein NXH75_09935 [Halobacteriovoraceae bacterium]|nr:hypothetical protein [Halobacteriovoraceae bacterium]
MFKTFTLILLSFGLIIHSCTPLEKKNGSVGPKLLKVKLGKKSKKFPLKYSAYVFLRQTKKDIERMDFSEELRRLGTPEEVKLRKRAIELRKTFNNAVKSYRNIGSSSAAEEKFEKLKYLMEQQKTYIVRNYGV